MGKDKNKKPVGHYSTALKMLDLFKSGYTYEIDGKLMSRNEAVNYIILHPNEHYVINRYSPTASTANKQNKESNWQTLGNDGTWVDNNDYWPEEGNLDELVVRGITPYKENSHLQQDMTTYLQHAPIIDLDAQIPNPYTFVPESNMWHRKKVAAADALVKEALSERLVNNIYDYLMPSTWAGLAGKAIEGGYSFNDLTDPTLNNYGWLTLHPQLREWAKKHPEETFAINFTSDILFPYGIKGVKTAANTVYKTGMEYRLANELNKSVQLSIRPRWSDNMMLTGSDPNHFRFKLGDVEINNPQLAYRQAKPGTAQNFLDTGYAFTPEETANIIAEEEGLFTPTIKQLAGIDPGYPLAYPMYSQGFLWNGIPTEGTSIPDLIVTAKPLRPANSKSYPIKSYSKAQGRRMSEVAGEVTSENASTYTHVPNYGYKKLGALDPIKVIPNSNIYADIFPFIDPETGMWDYLTDFAQKMPTLTEPKGIKISPEDLYNAMNKVYELKGIYVVGHGTSGAAIPNETFFNEGIRIRNAELSNNTTYLTPEYLTKWPHNHSENIVLLGYNPQKQYYIGGIRFFPDAFPEGTFVRRDLSNWKPKSVFDVLPPEWEINPSAILKGEPHDFVNTSHDKVIGVYNTETLTLYLNPQSLFDFNEFFQNNKFE